MRIIAKLDPDAPSLHGRGDVADAVRRSLLEEAPSAYKPVDPAMRTMADLGAAAPVARLAPLLTVKG